LHFDHITEVRPAGVSCRPAPPCPARWSDDPRRLRAGIADVRVGAEPAPFGGGARVST